MTSSSSRIVRRLARAALPAAPFALAAAPKLAAQVILTNPADITVTTGTIYLDMGTGGAMGTASTSDPGGVELQIRRAYGGTYTPKVFLYSGAQILRGGTSGNYFGPLAGGTVINGSLTFSGSNTAINNNGNNNAFWPAGTTGYIALQFNGGSGTNYGWAQISYNSDFSITLYQFAYEASGGSITIPTAIPEPATTAAFAALLAGSAALWRRRTQKTATPASVA